MRRRWLVPLLVLVFLAAPVAWYLGSPLFISKRVDEAFPSSAGAAIPQGMTQAQVEAEMKAAAGRDVAMTEAPPAGSGEAAVVARGSFRGADDFHRGEGSATIYRAGDRLILRLDPFRVTNGPGLYVILTRHPSPRSRTDVADGYLEVAKLKGNLGAQNYVLPALALDAYGAVVIYCKPFHVVFATAALHAVR